MHITPGEGRLTRYVSSFFRNSGLRQCLEVLELAQKYEMVGIENMLYNYLEEKLPTSAKDPIHAYEKYQHYEEGPTLAPLVLHVGSLKLIPWAFYSFGVRFSYNFDPSKKETYNPPPEILSVDSSYTYPLILLQHIIVQVLVRWRSRICSFYETTCSQPGKGTHPSCTRKSKQITAEHGHFLSPDRNPANPMVLMGSRTRSFRSEVLRHQGRYHNWCGQCIATLNEHMETTQVEMYQHLVDCVAQLKGRITSYGDS